MNRLDVMLSDVPRPLAVADVLVLGSQLAQALATLHARGVVHRAVAPHSILWSADRSRATLIDAGTAAAQGLAYAAPEQSGRMELPVDARSDLYSLGVVLYEALTGAPPFAADDALELIHAHIAKAAVAPAAVDTRVPAVLSAIVMRLLAKSPDERYPSAASLASDLERCTAAWQRDGRIETFALARHDRGARLAFPTRLIGREREAAALADAFDRAARGERALVVVEGYAGIGKTALIRRLVQPIVRERGIFIAGKFDQLARGAPFGALIEAFQALVRQMLGESEARLGYWRERLRGALGANAGVLIDVIPEIEFVVGAQPPPPRLGAAEALNRFQHVIERFVAAVASEAHPLVIFLDDLQWADAATLALLEPLATSPELGHLMLLGACRDSDAEADAPGASRLARTLAGLARAGIAVQRIALGPLDAGAFGAWLAAALDSDAAAVAPLAALVHAKTGGNPFFAMQFLRQLEREGQLRADPASTRWHYRLDAIEASPLADNVVELMTRSIRRLPSPAQYLLTLAACIGNRFDLATLATVSEQAPAATAADLAPALAEGLVVAAGAGGDHAFLHDRVQQAAYALIPNERRRMLHLTVGRLLQGRAGDAGLFDVVRHLNLGAACITEPVEQRALAALDLDAGRRAKAATAHETALELFDAGIALLGPQAPGSDAEAALRFELRLEAAECRHLCGEFDAALAALGALIGAAPTPLDRGRVIRLRCVQLEAMARFAESLASAREGLAAFGIVLPHDVAQQETALDAELGAIERHRAGRPIEALVDLPALIDPATLLAMAMLTDVWSCAYIIGEPTLARLISATLVRLSLVHGNAPESAYGYVTHAITVGALHADYRAADAYGRLALEVNRRFDDRRRRAKVYQQFHAHVNFWCQPVRTCMAYAREAYAAGLDGGDFLYAAYAAGTELWSAIACCNDLAAFVADYTPAIARIERLGNVAFADSVRLIIAWARVLQRRDGAPDSLDPLSLDGDGFDESRWLARYGEVRFFASIHAVAKLQITVLLGSPAEALAAARRSQGLIDAVPGTIWPVLHEFWHGLALARAADTAGPGEDRDAMRAAVRAACASFEARIEHNAENHRGPALLLRAEVARLEGDDDGVVAACEAAIEFTATLPLALQQALAHEWLGAAHLRRGRPALARLQLGRARELHAMWGAHAKAAALEAAYPAIVLQDPLARPASPHAPAARAAPAPPESASPEATGQLDLGSVLKAAQAIAAETGTARLLERLLHIAIENAGAERGALVLEGAAGPSLHTVDPGTAGVSAEPLDGSARVPATIVQRVRRTGETLVIDPVRADDPLVDDPYLRDHTPRALACLPVRRLGRAIGVLYVEHRRASGLFTPARVATLHALATQAAISLENARLVESLEAENSFLRRDLIAHVSHDLRTPLASLRGYLDLLAAPGAALAAATRSEYLGIALRQSERLATLIDELFELAKLEVKGVALEREPFVLAELAGDVVQKFTLMARSRGIELRAPAPDVNPGARACVNADLGLVERVLENLIGNALKHTGAGGQVEVSVRGDGDGVIAEVRDSGSGIAADDLPHIFVRGWRGRNGSTHGAGDGAGLGLAIARRIVELHGGTIAAASTPGEGSRLWFVLPAVSAKAD